MMIFQCPKCGFKLPMGASEFPLHCRCGHVSKDQDAKFGLGDRVAGAFSLLGVTRFVKYLTGSGKCADCEQRQAALNELGKSIGL